MLQKVAQSQNPKSSADSDDGDWSDDEVKPLPQKQNIVLTSGARHPSGAIVKQAVS